MRRKGLCLITGCVDKRLDTMVTRGQWSATESVGSHASYTLADAFNLRVLLVAMDEAGVDFQTAQYLMNAVTKLSMHPLNYPRNEGDMWIAAGVVKTRSDEIPTYKIHVAGRLDDIGPMAVQEMGSGDGKQLLSLISLNASEAAEHVREAACEIGLPEGVDYSLVWEHSRFPEWMQADLAANQAILAEMYASKR